MNAIRYKKTPSEEAREEVRGGGLLTGRAAIE
jgi:hypothetical protein